MLYKIDLIKIKGRGDFLCPCCKALISPDDETEQVYSILEAKVENDKLESLLIICKTCSSTILLTGFSILEYRQNKIHVV